MTDAKNTAWGREWSQIIGSAKVSRDWFRCECDYRSESARIPLPKEEHIR
jgi:hypothetical protein